MGKSVNRTIANCQGDICECLKDKIDELVNAKRTGSKSGAKGLVTRFAEQIAPGASPPGSDSWNNHMGNITNDQKSLNDHIEAYDDNKCPNGGLPSNAREYATKPLPTPKEWEANNPGVNYLDAAGKTAAAAGGLYLTYKVIRTIAAGIVTSETGGWGALVSAAAP